ncbi:MAG TPA: envelope stress response membrane protein PspB [Sphingomicrobium sp.]|nr:envelope stress response membrane protein PspB [Sphingomicrobium sp.]
MEEVIIIPIVMGILFVVLPWLIFHYVTKWKTAKTLTGADEQLLDDLHDAARRLDDRLCSIERIMTAENPDWRQNCLPGGAVGAIGRESRLMQDIDNLSSRTDRLLKDRK